MSHAFLYIESKKPNREQAQENWGDAKVLGRSQSPSVGRKTVGV